MCDLLLIQQTEDSTWSNFQDIEPNFNVASHLQPIAHPPKSQGAGRLLENILAAEPFPTRDTEFSELYNYQVYIL